LGDDSNGANSRPWPDAWRTGNVEEIGTAVIDMRYENPLYMV